MDRRVGVQSAEKLGIHTGDASRRFEQAFAVGVLAYGDENFSHGALDTREIDFGLGFVRHFGSLIAVESSSVGY